jgi:poly(A) polymerase
MQDAAAGTTGAGELGYRLGLVAARDVLLLRAALLGGPLDGIAMAQAETGAAAKFPVAAADLMPALTGAALGQRLAALETLWIASGFALTRAALLGQG